MKLVCTQENFNKAIFITQSCITKNINLPILSNILLQAVDGRFKLSATNLEIGINCWVGAKIEKEGTITVPAKTLSGFVSKLKPQKMELEVKNNSLDIITKEAKTDIKGMDAKDFPIIPIIKEKPILSLKISDFKAAISQVINAAAASETRPELTGIYTIISFKNKEVVMAATDSYRLAEKTIKFNNKKETTSPDDKEEMSFIIPKNTLTQLSRILGEEEGDIEISVAPSQISFDFNQTNVISRLIDGQYPDYKQIIPSEFRIKTTVNTKELINAVKIASIFTEERNSSFKLSLNHKESTIDISAESGSGNSISSVKAKIEEKKPETGADEGETKELKEDKTGQIIFNYRYFLDGLNNIAEEETTLGFNSFSSSKPVIMKGVGDESFLYIIMPIKL